MYLTVSGISPSLYQPEVRMLAVGIAEARRLRAVHSQADAAQIPEKDCSTV
jgi:hypothetical protein